MKGHIPVSIEGTKSANAQVPKTLPVGLVIAALAIMAAFFAPLYQWLRFGLGSDLFSYILLVPIVSAYLFYTTRSNSHGLSSAPYRSLAIALFICGGAVIGGYWFAKSSGVTLPPQDTVAFTTLPFVLLFAGVCAFWLPGGQFRGAVFPLSFLLFMVPFPVAMEHWIESFLQQGSAPPAYWLFRMVGTTIFREDLVFQLPGITLQIAPECSGIRSTLVLFMVSLLAGNLFLRSPWKRVVLTVFVIPLALIRNGFRVFTIGQLCVSVGPHMIDSAIHHRGGPIFFALSLIPFFVVVYFLVRSDRKAARVAPVAAHPVHG